jgi:quercetin dioxygenase-like cupin family protein
VHHQRGRVGSPTRRDVGESSGNPAVGMMMLDTLLEAGNIRVNAAVFQPGCRTWWHYHTEGQLFIVEHGRGMIATRSGEIQVVESGDLVYAPPGEEHWHGAAPDSIFVYTVVSIGETKFLEEVRDDVYTGAWNDGAGVISTACC